MSRKITVFLAVLVALVLPVMGESMSSGGSMMSGSPMSSGSSVMPGGSMIGTPAAGVPAAASTSAATRYTQCQQEVIQGIGLGFFMGRMATLASQGYNVTGFNAEVDRFNAWIQQNFGNDPNLLMPKMPLSGGSAGIEAVSPPGGSASVETISPPGGSAGFGAVSPTGGSASIETISPPE